MRSATPEGSLMESTITHGKPKLTGLKVLVIDDSKTIRRTAETLLTKEGCEVFTAVDGFDAMTWRGIGQAGAVAPILILLGFAALFAAVAAARFRWEEV